jgi:hypothetical protein
MDILKHYGFVVGPSTTSNTTIIDYMMSNDNVPSANSPSTTPTPANTVVVMDRSGASGTDSTESRRITDV